MKEKFGVLPTGEEANLYTISCGKLTAAITNCGAALVKLLVPDAEGNLADVVLGCDDISGYFPGSSFLGATVGRNANRLKGASFELNGQLWQLPKNEGSNNLHSGPDFFFQRMWKMTEHTETSVTLELHSPHGDQGFPGNAVIHVTYSLDSTGGLHIAYDAVSDQDTVFNFTNHSYFNLAGHEHPEKAYDQVLSMAARFYTPTDAGLIPTGETRSVVGTPMDFRSPKPIGRDVFADDEQLKLANGYDHNFEVFCNPCAILSDPESGRMLAISTDCPGIQFYSGNYLKGKGKGGIEYGARSGIAPETQFFPNALNQAGWKQPIVKAGQKYKSTTTYKFTW